MAREAHILGIFGKQGGGKTYRLKQEAIKYAKPNVSKGWRGRKVLILDVNPRSGSYSDIPTIDFDISCVTDVKKFETPSERTKAEIKAAREVLAWKEPSIRRVVAIRKDGTPMNRREINETCLILMNHFTDGQLILEDTNVYLTRSAQDRFVSALVTVRHRNCDLIMVFQSSRAPDPRMWGNISLVKMHKTIDSIDSVRNKIPEQYEILKIAELIVSKQFSIGNTYFFQYIDLRNYKLLNCPINAFTAACKEYVRIYPAEYKRFLAVNSLGKNDDNGLQKYVQSNANDYL
jgi:hypothetical protein